MIDSVINAKRSRSWLHSHRAVLNALRKSGRFVVPYELIVRVFEMLDTTRTGVVCAYIASGGGWAAELVLLTRLWCACYYCAVVVGVASAVGRLPKLLLGLGYELDANEIDAVTKSLGSDSLTLEAFENIVRDLEIASIGRGMTAHTETAIRMALRPYIIDSGYTVSGEGLVEALTTLGCDIGRDEAVAIKVRAKPGLACCVLCAVCRPSGLTHPCTLRVPYCGCRTSLPRQMTAPSASRTSFRSSSCLLRVARRTWCVNGSPTWPTPSERYDRVVNAWRGGLVLHTARPHPLGFFRDCRRPADLRPVAEL